MFRIYTIFPLFRPVFPRHSSVANTMFSFHNCITISLALTIAVVVLTDRSLGMGLYKLPCRPCSGAECDAEPPQICVYGEHRDRCNRRICSKGPGEKCGEMFNILGTCGEGLWCSSRDNRCHGCYIPTMACYPED